MPVFANVAPHILEVPAHNMDMPKRSNKPSIKYVTESLLQTIQAHADFPHFTDKQLREVQESMSMIEFKNRKAKFLTACCVNNLEAALKAVKEVPLNCSKLFNT